MLPNPSALVLKASTPYIEYSMELFNVSEGVYIKMVISWKPQIVGMLQVACRLARPLNPTLANWSIPIGLRLVHPKQLKWVWV